MIKTAQIIPDYELWLHQPEASAWLDPTLPAMIEPPSAADLDAHLTQLPGRGLARWAMAALALPSA